MTGGTTNCTSTPDTGGTIISAEMGRSPSDLGLLANAAFVASSHMGSAPGTGEGVYPFDVASGRGVVPEVLMGSDALEGEPAACASGVPGVLDVAPDVEFS